MQYINISDLCFGYEQDHTILEHIEMQVCQKESIGIIGANGVGKSTLLKLMVGLNTNYQGHIQIEDMFVEKKMLPYIREKMGYVFQEADNQLFMSTVYADVAFGPRQYGIKESEVSERVDKALEMVGLQHLKDKHVYKLSGGQKKLVSIATILSMSPDIILMDEPSIGLDPKNRRKLIHILNQLSLVKVIASHDLDLILDTCQRVILINGGRIVVDGSAKEILTNRQLLEHNGLELPLSLSCINNLSNIVEMN